MAVDRVGAEPGPGIGEEHVDGLGVDAGATQPPHGAHDLADVAPQPEAAGHVRVAGPLVVDRSSGLVLVVVVLVDHWLAQVHVGRLGRLGDAPVLVSSRRSLRGREPTLGVYSLAVRRFRERARHHRPHLGRIGADLDQQHVRHVGEAVVAVGEPDSSRPVAPSDSVQSHVPLPDRRQHKSPLGHV